jgi:uncharacterized membrane protein YbhN (UPF0104 family)
MNHARTGALALLVGVTVYGVWAFLSGDPMAAAEFWRDKVGIIPLVLLLACADVALEATGWMWVYERLGIKAFDSGGVISYLSGRAGLLLPAQLGRLIRPDAMLRLRRGGLRHCLKAEAVAFVLDSTSVAALLAGLLAYQFHPLTAPFAALVVIAVSLFLGDQIADRLTGTKLELPAAFWWRWKTLAIILIEMAGWVAHGVAFYLVIRGLPGNANLWDALFYAPASAVLGIATGLPGGIGATEGFLGASLRLMKIPSEHLVVAVGGFRLITFWLWLPVGWIALALLKKRAALVEGEDFPPGLGEESVSS